MGLHRDSEETGHVRLAYGYDERTTRHSTREQNTERGGMSSFLWGPWRSCFERFLALFSFGLFMVSFSFPFPCLMFPGT
jgi:hypothetical protein